MTAYPIGCDNGGSILTVLCCLAGALTWARRKQWEQLILCSAPVLLNLLAAALHRYPYGTAARLSQSLAPGLCLLAGLGLAQFLTRMCQQPARRDRAIIVATFVFTICGLANIARDLIRPHYVPGCRWMRTVMSEIKHEMPAGAPIVVCGTPQRIECTFAWYWLNEGERVSWDYQLPPIALARGKLWVFHEGPGADVACKRVELELLQRDPTWRLVKRIPYVYKPQQRKESPGRCELLSFERSS
jgi:hypothetical protein